jgi:hypothetical protein
MKTLREMMDQLDEISRRDLLKGAGAATALGGAGAVGYKLGKQPEKPTYVTLPESPDFYYLLGYLVQCLIGNETEALVNYKANVESLYKAVQVEMELMDVKKGHELSMAFSKGAAEGGKRVEGWKWMHKEMGNRDRLGYLRNEKLGEYIASHITPYYDKMQALLKQPAQEPLEETSPDAMSKIDELFGK